MARYTYIKKEPQWDGFSLLGRGGLSPFLTLDGPGYSALIEGNSLYSKVSLCLWGLLRTMVGFVDMGYTPTQMSLRYGFH